MGRKISVGGRELFLAMPPPPPPPPGQLAGPHLLGGRGHKEHSGSALVLSLPWDCDKKVVVRSRTLAACTLPWRDHRLQGRQVFPALAWVGRFLSVAESFFLLCPPPPPPLSFAGAFGHLASLVRLVPPSRLRMRFLQWHLMTYWSPESDHPSLPVSLSQAMWWISRCSGWC